MHVQHTRKDSIRPDQHCRIYHCTLSQTVFYWLDGSPTLSSPKYQICDERCRFNGCLIRRWLQTPQRREKKGNIFYDQPRAANGTKKRYCNGASTATAHHKTSDKRYLDSPQPHWAECRHPHANSECHLRNDCWLRKWNSIHCREKNYPH